MKTAEKFKKTQKFPKPSFEGMDELWSIWMMAPSGTQADFFKLYGWTRDSFFHKASERNTSA